jgi:hypothetical protein
MKTEKMTESYKQLYHNLINSILKGRGDRSQEQRQAAFNNANLPQPLQALIEKVAHHAYKVTDNDINVVKQNGISEDQLFELIVCGAVGQASRQYESAMTALAEAIKEGGYHAS